MTYTTLLLEHEGPVARITFNHPENRNAISAKMICDILTALDDLEKTRARVVIITGAGSALCAGMDLEMLSALGQQSAQENQQDSRRRARMFRRIWRFAIPLIAALNRHALACGCGTATRSDLTSGVPAAKSDYTDVEIAFPPPIAPLFLPRQIGDKRARDLLLTGRLVLAEEAKELGLVTEIVPAEKLISRCAEIADQLIAASPGSLTRAKRLLTSAAAASVDADLERAVLENARIRATPDFKEGLASFLEKRKPVWQGED